MPPPTKIAVALFPGFQLLDVAGPLDILNQLALTHPITLSILAASLDPVTTAHEFSQQFVPSQCAQQIVPTHTFEDAPEGIEMLLVPGGYGTRMKGVGESVGEFVRRWYAEGRKEGKEGEGEGRKKWLLTVCTGSALVAGTGLLDGKKATTNKKRFNDVKAQYPAVDWVPQARWVTDGDIWTSSGISAGMDLTLAWVASLWGEETAQEIADATEYAWHKDAGEDPFAARWGAK